MAIKISQRRVIYIKSTCDLTKYMREILPKRKYMREINQRYFFVTKIKGILTDLIIRYIGQNINS